MKPWFGCLFSSYFRTDNKNPLNLLIAPYSEYLDYGTTVLFVGLLQERKHQKEPTLLFENIVVVGLHPNTDIQATEVSLTRKKSFEDAEGSEILKDGFKYHHRGLGQQNLEPQVGTCIIVHISTS